MEHRDRDFRGVDIVLEGKFSGCTFIDCRVCCRGDAFDLVACTFDGETDWVFEGAAVNTFNLLSILYQHDEGAAPLRESIHHR